MQLLATLEAIPYVAVTSDIWTSRVTQAYITLTVHFITDSWKMDSMVLQTQEMPERHTGVNIHAQLSTASEKLKIKEKVVALVRDNVSIMVAASQLLEDLPCFAHTLQLAVKAGLELPVLDRLSAVCRKIVGHFKHSVLAMQALKEKQMNMNVARHLFSKM